MDAFKKSELLQAAETLRNFIEEIKVQKSCLSCFNWDNGCGIAQGQTPPKEVMEEGCPSWLLFDEIPY